MFSPNNTSQDPEYEGPTFHEKKMHKTHFHVLHTSLKRRKEGDKRSINGTLYIWRDGKWNTGERT